MTEHELKPDDSMSDSSGNRTPEGPLAIRVCGARTHNLRDVHVSIPLGSLTVITGVSGSGKSSLTFDTIFAEGRHRYLASVSPRSRELIQGIDRPDVDFIDGLPPVLCIEQRMQGARKRSTVATVSDIYDYLRLLYARIGQLYCPNCQLPVSAQSRVEIVEQALRFQDRQKIVVLAPVVRGRAGEHAETFARIVKDGYVRARVDGLVVDAADPPALERAKPHDIEIVVDRLIVKDGFRSRLEESLDLALQLGQGQCVLSHEADGGWQDRLYSTILACTNCGTSYPSLEPRSFSFNSAIGACPNCEGLGFVAQDDESEQRCPECQGTRLGPIPRSVLIDKTNITDLCAMSPRLALESINRWTNSYSSPSDIENNHGLTTAPQLVAAKHILPEIANRLQFLSDVGLDYLTLDRSGETLSAGELQRTRLAACLGSRLTGVCYILDEPTAGLHPRDTQRLMRSLFQLRDEGNTLVLVEHDLEVVRQSDYVIDLGPGAGSAGGHVVAAGTPTELALNPNSVTGRFLEMDRDRLKGEYSYATGQASLSDTESAIDQPALLRLAGATLHNLKSVTIEIPLHRIVCVTGVSGSGKTSLVMQTLVPAVRKALGERNLSCGPFQELSGVEQLSKLVRIDQSPVGRSARSSPATYSGIWDDVRQVFVKTKESRLRGYTARRFSLAVPEARCPKCAGRGELAVEEHRFAGWNIRCPECDGRRFAPATLSIRYRGQSVADVLEMSISEAATFFENFPRLARTLGVLNELGLGYLKLGQSALTLSGGESQRIKLGTELAKSGQANEATLFVLDEPTSGLHAADVQQLVSVLRRLVSVGHSVLVIEHNRELIDSSDWIIDIGPGAGDEGGRVVSAGVLAT